MPTDHAFLASLNATGSATPPCAHCGEPVRVLGFIGVLVNRATLRTGEAYTVCLRCTEAFAAMDDSERRAARARIESSLATPLRETQQ